MPEPKARCEYRLPPDVYLRIEREARDRKMTRSEYVRRCLERYWADEAVRPTVAPFTGYRSVSLGTVGAGEEIRIPLEDVDHLSDFHPVWTPPQPPPARRRWWQRRQPHTSES